MRRPTATVRARIVWTTAAVSAIAVAAMIAVVLFVLSRVEQRSVSSSLHDQLAIVSSSVAADGDVSKIALPDDALQDTTWIYSADGSLVSGPDAGRHVQAVADGLAGVTRTTAATRGDRAYLAAPVRSVGASSGAGSGSGAGRSPVVVVTESLDVYEKIRHAVTAGLLALGVIVTGGAAAIASWTVRRTFAPVQQMASRAEEWSEHDLESRFDVRTGSDEIVVLGQTLNVLLDRVAGAIRSEQQLTSEVAHELRTPLTAVRGEAELALMVAGADGGPATERLERIVALVDRMTVTIATLVDLARGHATGPAHVSLQSALESVVDELPAGSQVAVDLSGVDPRLELAAPVELIRRAVSPLVDNAVKHATSRVTVTAQLHERHVDIGVSDDGQGIDVPDLEHLFLAGVRGDDDAGAGLGLALSRRVARMLGGDVTVTSAVSPTTFTVTLPRY